MAKASNTNNINNTSDKVLKYMISNSEVIKADKKDSTAADKFLEFYIKKQESS
jgi:hypothetical protein